jgi:hypothetical protein
MNTNAIKFFAVAISLVCVFSLQGCVALGGLGGIELGNRLRESEGRPRLRPLPSVFYSDEANKEWWDQERKALDALKKKE